MRMKRDESMLPKSFRDCKFNVRVFRYVRVSFAKSILCASCMEIKKYLYVKLKSCIINGGTFNAAKSFSVLSKPVESIKRLRVATQNHIRVVNTRNLITPSKVIVKVILPMFVLHMGFPLVKNMAGMDIKAINSGISVVRVKSCFKEMCETKAKTIGNIQISNKYESLWINNAEIIIAAIATIFAMGCIVCIKPFLSLKSST